MKMAKIFSFEFAYLVRRSTASLYLTILLLFTLAMNALTTPGDGVVPNNTLHITGITVIGGFIWLLMGAAVAGEAGARDVKLRMHSLVFTSPVTKAAYLGGRFLAAFTVNALLMLSLPLGVLLSFYLPGLAEDGLQPFRPLAYLNVYFLIALPNAFIATAIQFCFATLSRQVMTSYLASLLLAIVAQLLAMAVAKLFGNWDLVKLLDPFGVTGIIGSELATWTPAEKNTRLIRLEGMFLWNRVLWLAIAGGALAFTYLKFNFATGGTNRAWRRQARRRKEQEEAFAPIAIPRSAAINVPQAARSFGAATYWSQVMRIAGTSFQGIEKHPLGISLVAVVALVSVVFGDRIMTQFDIPLLPTTQQVLDYFTAPVGNLGTPLVIVPLLLIFFSGELVWRERDAGLGDIADAAPVSEWVLLTGKFLALVLIIFAWMLLVMAGGVLMQLRLGYHQLETGRYLQVLFGLQFWDYLLFALLALVVQVIVNQKFAGYAVMLLVLCFMAFPALFKVEHNLFVFGADPGWWYTDMRGFGNSLGPWLWFKVYWTGWALLLAVAARLLWPRGRAQGFRYRLQFVRRRFTRSTVWMAGVGLCLLLGAGAFIFYGTNVRHEYQSSSTKAKRKADYERRYAQYSNIPQPQLTATKLQVELYPERQRADISATYTLVNMDSVAIAAIHLGSVSGVAPAEVAFSRPFVATMIDKELGHYIYTLGKPLAPGDSVQVRLIVNYSQHGFQNGGGNALVVKNGTYFTNYDLLPAIGYQPARELDDAVVRKKYGLPARPGLPSLYDAVASRRVSGTDQNTFEVVVGTAGDEVAVAPGRLLKSWIKGNRRYFEYKADAPIGAEYSILSGGYAVQESSWNDVVIRHYYHPAHAANTDRMLRSIKASLAYFTEQFGPYPFGHFTLIERAGAGGGGTADASIIYYGEQYPLMIPDDSEKGFDLPYYILAHEVAHQWWGMARLTPAYVEGAGVLIEGLAVYSGMQVLEKAYGAGHVRKYLGYLHSSFQMPRSLASASLLQADESFLYYKKGGLAMYTLSRYIGKDKVNAALRGLLQKRLSGALPLPTTLDLYRQLAAVTPDSLHYLLNDLFKKNMYWRLKTEQVTAAQTKEGTWEATLHVTAQKVIVDRAGREIEVPMNDWLEIGLYEKRNGVDKPLYLQMHRVRSGRQTIKVAVPKKPERGGIDPNYLMIDLRLEDNIRELGG